MLVCYCMAVTEREVREAILRGAGTPAEIGRACRAGTGCTGCHMVLQSLLEEVRSEREGAHSPALEAPEIALGAS